MINLYKDKNKINKIFDRILNSLFLQKYLLYEKNSDG